MEETTNNEIQFDGLGEKEAKEFKKLLAKFIKSYSKKEEGVSDEVWLTAEFKTELPELTDEEAARMAHETVTSIAEYDENLKDINESAAQGINKEQWLVDNIAKASVGMSVLEQGQYLHSIDTALMNANVQMMQTVTTNVGNVSMNQNLDGFIAEQYHVNTFNAKAALEKSNYYAEVMVPEPGTTYPKNSFDVVIRDKMRPNATPVHQYQVKYGATANDTIQMLREHGNVTRYSNQQLVVPAEQVEAVKAAFPGKTVVSTIGGTDKVKITSNPLTKAQAKKMQLETQADWEYPRTDWNVLKNKDLALHISKNATLSGLHAAVLTTGFSLAAQVIKGEGIDTEKTVETALKTGTDAGIKAATTGALKVGVEKGTIGLIPKGTPLGIIANIACVGIENVKILAKVATGELTMPQALDRMGRTSTSMVYGMGWGAKGIAIGAVALKWIPIVGPVVGGLVGGMIGYMAGSEFGRAVYSGLKTIGKGVKSACKSVWNGVNSVGNKIKNFLFG